ncbi:copper chaperone PCu(A)C [Paracoccus cavernae]
MFKPTLTAFAVMMPAFAFAQTANAPVSVTEAFARSSNPKSGAAYMVLTNDGTSACTLAGIATDLADRAELHTMRDENGVMKMMPADPLVLEPATSHKLARGGDHVMLMGIHEPLVQGQMIPLTFDFGDCGTLNAEVMVNNETAPARMVRGMVRVTGLPSRPPRSIRVIKRRPPAIVGLGQAGTARA